jgi:hypothetical protein
MAATDPGRRTGVACYCRRARTDGGASLCGQAAARGFCGAAAPLSGNQGAAFGSPRLLSAASRQLPEPLRKAAGK